MVPYFVTANFFIFMFPKIKNQIIIYTITFLCMNICLKGFIIILNSNSSIYSSNKPLFLFWDPFNFKFTILVDYIDSYIPINFSTYQRITIMGNWPICYKIITIILRNLYIYLIFIILFIKSSIWHNRFFRGYISNRKWNISTCIISLL